MKIETKFDVGQKVWRISWGHCNALPPKYFGYSVDGQVQIVSKGDNGTYWIKCPKCEICWPEDHLFTTKTEAQAECDRRNGKEKRNECRHSK